MQWLSFLLVFMSGTAFAQAPATPAEPDFDSLGGNKALYERAKALQPETQSSVVQNRAVDRRRRVELAPEISGVLGGDTYSRTRSIGLNGYFHFNPHWAIGAKYNYSFNSLTPEGEQQVQLSAQAFEKDPANPDVPYPDVDFPKTEYMGVVNWYPLYGKFAVLERRVVHFDFYALAGAGKTQLQSGWTNTYTGGAGLGLWLTQHMSTRFEMRYQAYGAKYKTGARRLDLTVASFQMGWLL